jgi:hypothetical protein
VILVEGIAEQLRVPALAALMGRPLSRSGVAVINIGGVAFPPFAELFGPDELLYRCVIISDGHPPKRSADAADDEDEDERAGSPACATASTSRCKAIRRRPVSPLLGLTAPCALPPIGGPQIGIERYRCCSHPALDIDGKDHSCGRSKKRRRQDEERRHTPMKLSNQCRKKR